MLGRASPRKPSVRNAPRGSPSGSLLGAMALHGQGEVLGNPCRIRPSVMSMRSVPPAGDGDGDCGWRPAIQRIFRPAPSPPRPGRSITSPRGNAVDDGGRQQPDGGRGGGGGPPSGGHSARSFGWSSRKSVAEASLRSCVRHAGERPSVSLRRVGWRVGRAPERSGAELDGPVSTGAQPGPSKRARPSRTGGCSP